MANAIDTGLLPEGKGFARQSFIGAAAVCITVAVPGSAMAMDTPVLRLYREYMEVRAQALAADDDDDGEAFFLRFDAIEAAIMELPSTCAADFAAKMLVTHSDGDCSLLCKNDPVWQEARALVEGAA